MTCGAFQVCHQSLYSMIQTLLSQFSINWVTQTTTESPSYPLSHERATIEQCIFNPFSYSCREPYLVERHIHPRHIFFSRYVITPACVVMLHMGRPIAALFVQAHNWTAVIWLPASAKASTYCPHSPAADDVCVWFPLCPPVCVHVVRCIYIWKSADVIVHAESQENWSSSACLVALVVESTRMEHARVHTHTEASRWTILFLGECYQINMISAALDKRAELLFNSSPQTHLCNLSCL